MTTEFPAHKTSAQQKTVLALTVLGILLIAGWFLYDFRSNESSRTVVKTWEGFKHYFILPEGRVLRPKDADTVSEGQAYAMLRAVWLNDKGTFDRCYRWTRLHLSRAERFGDRLLAWRWKDGRVIDWGSASDADIDYALALVFAENRWSGLAPKGLSGLGQEAKGILGDILRLETYRTSSGRLYLSPWVIDPKDKLKVFPVNPSYYSPAHFRIFKSLTADKRWDELTDTGYFVLNSLSEARETQAGVGLVPDWAGVDAADRFSVLPGRSDVFGWDAVRIPFRVALDREWFKAGQANTFLKRFAGFLRTEWKKQKAVYCVYSYSGRPVERRYENPAFYSCYAVACRDLESKLAAIFLNKTGRSLVRIGGFWIYVGREDYYVNCLSWYADGFRAGYIRNLTADGK